MKYTLIPIISILLTLTLRSQTIEKYIKDDSYLDKEFIESVFTGGFDGYTNFFRENLVFPEVSFKAQKEGLLLFNFKVNPLQQKVEVEFLTYIDKEIEKNVRGVVEKSLSQWNMAEDKDYRFYQCIIYSLIPYYPQTLAGDLPDIPAALPLKFIQPFVLIKSKRIPKDLNVNLKEEEAGDKINERYEYAQKMYQQMRGADKPKIAYESLTELIRYNPLNRDYLLDRIRLEKELKLNKYQVYDASLLQDFVDSDLTEEYSIEELIALDNIEAIERQVKLKQSKEAVDSLYLGQYERYEDLFKEGFYSNSFKNFTSEGVVIFTTTVTNGGDVFVNFLTRLDDKTQKIVTSAIQYSMYNWLAIESGYQFYQAIFISRKSLYQDQFVGQIDGFPELPLTHPFLPTFSFVTGSETDNAIEEDKVALYNSLQSELEALLSKNETKKAYEVINQLIGYNPFDKDMIERRMRIEAQLKKNDFTPFDKLWLDALDRLKLTGVIK